MNHPVYTLTDCEHCEFKLQCLMIERRCIMQRYNQLSHEELIALNEEKLERLVQIEIAHNGILPVEAPEKITLETDGIIKNVVGYEVFNTIFKKKEDAEKVVQMAVLKEEYNYNIGYEYKWLVLQTDVRISQVFYYKQEDVVRIKDVLQKNTLKKSEYEKQKNEYDIYIDKSSKARSEVYDTYNNAKHFQNEIDQAKQTFELYKDLADGDITIATNFFKKNYADYPNIIEKVITQSCQEANEG